MKAFSLILNSEKKTTVICTAGFYIKCCLINKGIFLLILYQRFSNFWGASFSGSTFNRFLSGDPPAPSVISEFPCWIIERAKKNLNFRTNFPQVKYMYFSHLFLSPLRCGPLIRGPAVRRKKGLIFHPVTLPGAKKRKLLFFSPFEFFPCCRPSPLLSHHPRPLLPPPPSPPWGPGAWWTARRQRGAPPEVSSKKQLMNFYIKNIWIDSSPGRTCTRRRGGGWGGRSRRRRRSGGWGRGSPWN